MRQDYNSPMIGKRAALLSFALALAACADLRWTRAGADDAEQERDLTACRQLAREQAARSGNLGLPPPAADPRFGPTGPSQAEQRMQEQQALEACMRARGYTLAPLER